MTEKPPPERRSDKDAESEDTPMRRFEDLARKLLRIAPERIENEQARYEEENGDGKRRSKLRTS